MVNPVGATDLADQIDVLFTENQELYALLARVRAGVDWALSGAPRSRVDEWQQLLDDIDAKLKPA